MPKPYNDPNPYLPAIHASLERGNLEYLSKSAWSYAIDPSPLVYYGPVHR